MTDLGYNPQKFINKKGEVNSYWWDGKANFGDLIGPYIINKISGKPVVNVRNNRSESAIFSVGSIITMLDRKGAIVWGSGLISELDDNQAERLTRAAPIVKAVRGKLTKHILEERLGWNIPNVFGDPALLLPDYYWPTAPKNNDIVICPHFSHKHHFNQLQETSGFHVLDVASPLEEVLSSIASASICISSSLHGIIVAQAYGIPWVWLYFEDAHLSGSDLKFRDFFSTLEPFNSGCYEIKKGQEITNELLSSIATSAVLPKTAIDLEELRQAFPQL